MIETMIGRFRDGKKGPASLFGKVESHKRQNRLRTESPLYRDPKGLVQEKELWQVTTYEMTRGMRSLLGEAKVIALEILD